MYNFKTNSNNDLCLNINFKEISQLELEQSMIRKRNEKIEQLQKRKKVKNMEKLLDRVGKNNNGCHEIKEPAEKRRNMIHTKIFDKKTKGSKPNKN